MSAKEMLRSIFDPLEYIAYFLHVGDIQDFQTNF